MLPNFVASLKDCWRSHISIMDEKTTSINEKAFEAYKKKDFTTASDLFRECIRLLDEQKDLITAAEMRNNLSVVLLELKNPEEAFAILQDTDQVFANANDKQRQAMALGNKASALQAMGKLPEALSIYERSADIFKEINEKEMRSITLKKISDLQLKTGKQYQALASLEAAYDQNDKKTRKEQILKGFLGTLIKKITHRS